MPFEEADECIYELVKPSSLDSVLVVQDPFPHCTAWENTSSRLLVKRPSSQPEVLTISLLAEPTSTIFLVYNNNYLLL
jgi:hypothetical protein